MTIYRPIGDLYAISVPGNLSPATIVGATMQWSDDDSSTYARIGPGDPVTGEADQARAPYGDSLQAAAASATELYVRVFIDGGVSDDYKPTNVGILGGDFGCIVQDFSSIGSTTQGWVEFGPFTSEADSTSGLLMFGGLSDVLGAADVFAFFTGGHSGNENYTYVTEFALRIEGGAPAPYVPPTTAHPSLRMLQRGGSGGMSGIWRMVGNPTTRDSLRRGPGSIL